MEDRRRRLSRMLPAALATLLLAAPAHPAAADGSADGGGSRRVLLLGYDGLDPFLLQRFMDAGQLPSFRALAQRGDFSRLETVMPPQSPVAWATVITGQDPGGTGIFDFLHRDPVRMLPVFSAAEVRDPEPWVLLGISFPTEIDVGLCTLPLRSGEVVNTRDGVAFWQHLDEHGVPATILKMPSNYPPVKSRSRTLSGMGTPDLRGTYGIFQLYTDDELLIGETPGGGEIHAVKVVDGKFEARIEGPTNAMKEGLPRAEVPFRGYVDPEHDVVRVDVAGAKLLLSRGEWSEWVQLDFPLCGPMSMAGMVRFHLAQAHPRLKLYVSPVNIDPTAPAQPISTPEDYAAEIADAIGLFYTQGMPEDTQALAAGAIDDAGFLAQAAIIRREEDRMLDFALEGFHEGFLFVYFSLVDQVSHMMWRGMDPHHPMWSPALGSRVGDAIPAMYRAVDEALGRALAKVGDDTLVLVISDHGFAPFYREVNLNTWLKDQGYLVLTDDALEAQTNFFNHVDWGRTRAYAMGFNSLYVNRRGRERWGIVDPGPETEALLDEIEEKLLAWVDRATGVSPVTKLYRSPEIYRGVHVGEAPDALVGFRRTYRSSDSSALGKLDRPLIQDRLEPWTGDHLMEAEAVPGAILCNCKLAGGVRRLLDIAPTVLDAFGIPPGPGMTGRSLLTE